MCICIFRIISIKIGLENVQNSDLKKYWICPLWGQSDLLVSNSATPVCNLLDVGDGDGGSPLFWADILSLNHSVIQTVPDNVELFQQVSFTLYCPRKLDVAKTMFFLICYWEKLSFCCFQKTCQFMSTF